MPSRITAQQLATRLGLSRATVSIVLRGDAQRRKISAKTTQAVLNAAKRHNYVPNLSARMLRRQRSEVIGVIFPNFRLDWAERAMSGMLKVLGETRYSPFVATHQFKPELFRKEVHAAMQRRDDALICYPLPGMNDLFENVRAAGIPLIFIGDRPGDLDKGNWAIWDAAAAAAAAVDHLVEQGRQRIAFLGLDYPMKMSVGRFIAYKKVLKKKKLPINSKWIFQPPSRSTIEEIVQPGLDQMFSGSGPHPDALFALNDGIALPLLQELERRGIRVPEDVAVVGMGDLPLTGYHAIGLSTLREPVEEMGQAAAEIAMKLINQPRHKPIQRLLKCEELHQRRTTIGARWSDPPIPSAAF
jgi:LacI family transcriptional regulator